MNPLAPIQTTDPQLQGPALPTAQELTQRAEDWSRQQMEEQARLEEEHGVLGTMALQGARGALDAALAPGALLGAASEGLGKVIGSREIAQFGGDLAQFVPLHVADKLVEKFPVRPSE